MKRLCVLAALLIVGCGSSASSPARADSTFVSPAASATNAISPSPARTASPTAAPTPQPIAVDRFSQTAADAYDSISVELRNPNADVGLVRARFNIAVLAADGSVITVLGEGGLPGSLVSTIYQLPPGGIYGVQGTLPGKTKVDSVEFAAIDKPVDWRPLKPAVATITGPKLTLDSGFATVTGRVTLDQKGPFNVIVQAFLEGPSNGFSVVYGVVDCMDGSAPRAFELLGEPPAGKGVKLSKVVAYVTTVSGAGDTQAPPGC